MGRVWMGLLLLGLLSTQTGCRGAGGVALLAGASLVTAAAVTEAVDEAIDHDCHDCHVHVAAEPRYPSPYQQQPQPICAEGYFYYRGYCYHAAYYRAPLER